MVKKIYSSLANVITDDLKASRLLFLLVGLSFLTFAFFGANLPLKWGVPHRAMNGLPCVTSLLIFFYITFFPTTVALRQQLVIVVIYVINFIGIYIMYGTEFMDMYAYQFMVGYILSAFFFPSKKSLMYFMAVTNVFVITTCFASHARSSGAMDFYMLYIACQIVFVILYKYRFSTEEKLIASEQQYRLLAENSFDIICVHNQRAKIKFASPSITRVLGYRPDELIGKYPVDIVHKDDEHIMLNMNFTDSSLGFLNKPQEFRLRNKNGEYTWFETIFTLLDVNDTEGGFILSQSRDVSKRKGYQLALEERTKELERSNADLETFAFVSSHDMQEPLRMISNYTQLLKKRYAGKLDKEADEYIDFANNGATTLQQLLRDLLSYSRITRANVMRAPVNMNLLVEDVLRNLKFQIEERNAQVIYNELHPVKGDRNLIMLVMQNLISNGVKYNQSVNPEIKISCSSSGNEVTYCIEDNGIGIESKYYQRIFEPFQRLHARHEYPGTGLGLSICKKIVEKSNGKIWLESEPDKGTRFYVSLS